MNNEFNSKLDMGTEKSWIESFEQEMAAESQMDGKWGLIIQKYKELSVKPDHAKYKHHWYYMYSRIKSLAKYDIYSAGKYLLYLARCGSVKELTGNPDFLSLRSVVNHCMNELYLEKQDNYLALIMGIAYYESSLPLPVGYAKGRDLAVKYFKAAQKNLDKCAEEVCDEIKEFIECLTEYENIRKCFESYKWKGDVSSAKSNLKEVEKFYEPLKDNFLYDFILREMITWYGYCENYNMQYKAIKTSMGNYPGDEILPSLLTIAEKRRLNFWNILGDLPFMLLCMVSILLLPVIGALFTIAFFDSLKAGAVVFLVLLVIRIVSFKSSSGGGTDSSALDLLEGFFWGRM